MKRKNKKMKHLKLYIAFLSVFVCTNILAQKQTKFITGGNAGLNFNFNENHKQLSMSCSPMLGYRLTKNIVIGTELYTSVSFAFTKGELTNRNIEIGITPFVQLYITKNIFFKPNVGIGFAKHYDKPYNSFNKRGEYTLNYKTITYGLGIGYDIHITNSFSITPIIGYQFTDLENTKWPKGYKRGYKKQDAIELRVGFVYRF
jgi:hypothetical protein